MRRGVLWLVALLGLGGCAHTPLRFACPRLAEFRYRLDAAPSDSRAAPASMAPLMSAMTNALARPHSVPESAAPTPRSILVLSGGGPWGAYGAGLLAGWSASATTPRPAFDLVTGVSTGALQATFAFLGSAYDPALLHAYTIDRERDLIDRRGLARGALAGSFAGTRPLVKRVRASLAPVYDAVAREAARGRLLLVGVVDALDGEMYAIDLTRIAAGLRGRERADCYTGALMASAAVPIEFDRVELGGRPYFDGGVRRSVFVTDIQRAAAHAMPGGNAPSRLYILINGDPRAERIDRLATGLVATLARLRTLAVNQIEMSSIEEVARAAPPGFETDIASAEGHRCGPSDAGHDAVFDPAFMRCLIDFGRSRWRSGGAWQPRAREAVRPVARTALVPACPKPGLAPKTPA